MAGAFTAVVNDSNAALFNPAGLAQIPQMEVSFASARLFSGLEGVDVGVNYFSYFYPVNQKTGNFGITWASLSSPALYREDTGTISYGRYIDDFFGNLNLMNKIDVALGVNLKYLRNEFDTDIRTINDPVFEKGSAASALTADLGVLVNWQDTGLSFGLASKNITRPNIGLKTDEQVPNENVLGFAYYREKMPYLGLPYFTAALDLVSREKNLDYRLGAETWLFDGKFAIRLGARQQEMAFGLGYEIKVMQETKLIIDYAFAWPFEVEETIGSHRLGLTLRFP